MLSIYATELVARTHTNTTDMQLQARTYPRLRPLRNRVRPCCVAADRDVWGVEDTAPLARKMLIGCDYWDFLEFISPKRPLW